MSEIKKVRTLTIGGKTYQLGGDGEGGDSYVLPTASEQELGGIKAAAKGENDTIEVKIGDDGKLYVEPTNNEGGDSDYATNIGSDGASYDYDDLQALFTEVADDIYNKSETYSRAEVDALIVQELNNALGDIESALDAILGV